MTSYTPISFSSHLGQDLAGHYQSALRIQPTLLTDVNPVTWLLTQDDCRPQPVWQIPGSILQNVTVVWLVRSDCVHIPLMRFEADAASLDRQPPADPALALLELVSNTSAVQMHASAMDATGTS